MGNLQLGLHIAAFVLFLIAAIPWAPSNPHAQRLIAAGLACWVLATFIK